MIAVRLHHAFGWSGGARGVDIGGLVFPRQLGEALVELRGRAVGRCTLFG